MRILVTGAAGFIGYHVTARLLARGDTVVGLDNLNVYYDPLLKQARLASLESLAQRQEGSFLFQRVDIANEEALGRVFDGSPFDRVIHLAAQAGVRHSLENPRAYINSNVLGFTNILECCRHARVPHLTYASSSSVYGSNARQPFDEGQGVDHPLQLYAASKRANELMAHSYSHLFALPTTGLRFFTVYGPFGRPDMALFLFTRAILAGEPIRLFNHGTHARDFTFVDDVVEAILRSSDAIARPAPGWRAADPDPASSSAPFRIYNVGNSQPVSLLAYVEALEDCLGKKSKREYLPMQPGDVPETFADVSRFTADFGDWPRTSVRDGVARFVQWYRSYYGT